MASALAAKGSVPREEIDHDWVVKDFAGVNTQAGRTAIKPEEFSWLENAMPVGHANLKCVPFQGAPVATIAGVNITYWKYVNIGNVDYLICVNSAGGAHAVNLSSFAVTLITGPGTFTGLVSCAQWKNERVLFIAGNGYFDWNGTTFTNDSAAFTVTGSIGPASTTMTITVAGTGQISVGMTVTGAGVTVGTIVTALGTGTGGTGTYIVNNAQTVGSETLTITPTAPSAGQTIATFSGRVWIFNNRTGIFSAPNSYQDFTTANSGGSFIITDETLHSNVNGLEVANNFLYVFGDASINLISDVRLGTGSPIPTLFSNTNITAQIGTNLPLSIFPYYRTVAFATRYGFYGVVGSTPQKIKDDLDGIIPFIDFTKPVSGGVANIFNILCMAFAFTYNDPIAGPRALLALQFNNKWFFASQGDTLTIITDAFQAGTPALFGTDGSKIYKLFSDQVSIISSMVQTALWPMQKPTKMKEAQKVGIEITLPSVPVPFPVTLDSDFGSVSVDLFATTAGEWINGTVLGSWINGTTIGAWGTAGFIIYQGDAPFKGRYVGYTIRTEVPGYSMNGFLMQHQLSTNWATRAS